MPIEPADVGDAGEPAIVEGVRGEWRVDPEALAGPFTGRTALLSPFDRLVHDRGRALELFDFEYTLEMYKPKAQRRWGYFALPVLHDDRLVGKVDATADRKGGDAASCTRSTRTCRSPGEVTDAVRHELEGLATWPELTVKEPGSVRWQASDPRPGPAGKPHSIRCPRGSGRSGKRATARPARVESASERAYPLKLGHSRPILPCPRSTAR